MQQAPSAPRQDQRITVVEILGYAGTAIALVGTGAVVGAFTSGSRDVTILVTIAVAVALFAAGLLLGSSAEDRLQRMRGVQWFLSVIAFLGFIGTLIEPSSKTEILLVLLVSDVVAAALWFISRRTLQQLAMYLLLLTWVIVLTTDFGAQPGPVPVGPLPIVPGAPEVTVTAVVLILIGAAWLALGVVGLVEPARTTRVLGSITMLEGAFMLSGESQELAFLLVAIFGAGMLAIGNMRSDRATGGIGIVGLLIGVAALFGTIVEGNDSGSIISLVVGVGVVLVAIVLGRSWGKEASTELPPPTVEGTPPTPPPPPSDTAPPPPPPEPRPPNDQMWS